MIISKCVRCHVPKLVGYQETKHWTVKQRLAWVYRADPRRLKIKISGFSGFECTTPFRLPQGGSFKTYSLETLLPPGACGYLQAQETGRMIGDWLTDLIMPKEESKYYLYHLLSWGSCSKKFNIQSLPIWETTICLIFTVEKEVKRELCPPNLSFIRDDRMASSTLGLTSTIDFTTKGCSLRNTPSGKEETAFFLKEEEMQN